MDYTRLVHEGGAGMGPAQDGYAIVPRVYVSTGQKDHHRGSAYQIGASAMTDESMLEVVHRLAQTEWDRLNKK